MRIERRVFATTTLTANPTGGSGQFATDTWRDAQDNIVGTNPTYDAGAGTYTVTDFVCVTATSSAFVVNEDAPLGVTIQNDGANTLSANVTGGSGSITSTTWRDAQSNSVGTNPTYAAGPGTYTVTITDASCGPATSAPVTIAAPAVATPVPTLSESVLCALIALLGAVAVMRMR